MISALFAEEHVVAVNDVADAVAAPDVVAATLGECSSGVPRMLSGAKAEALSTAGE
jgi:hypothetical protein